MKGLTTTFDRFCLRKYEKNSSTIMRSLKLLLLFFVIMGCQDSSEKRMVDSLEKRVADTSCECATIHSMHSYIYIGMSNPFRIISNCSESTKFDIIHSGNLEVNFDSDTSFIIKSYSSPRNIKLELVVKKDDEIKVLDKRHFKLKRIPGKTPIFTRRGKSQISLNELKAYIDSGINVESINHDINGRFTVISYNITVARENQQFLKCLNKGGKLEEHCQEILQQVESGDILIFDNIFIKNLTDNKEKVHPLVLTIK